jgi:hypothetical protein
MEAKMQERYDAQYAADMQHEALVEAVAQSLMDACYGKGSWSRIAHRPEGQGQRGAFISQARAAVAVVERWHHIST